MANKTIIIYSTVDGHTLKICARLKTILEKENHETELTSIGKLSSDPEDFDKIVIASSIRYGKHHEDVIRFVRDHYEILNRKRSAFISVNLVARKEAKATADTNPYVKKFLREIDWTPGLTAVFAGCLDYQKYSFSDRWMIRLIMLLTGGPLVTREPLEYTNWQQVDSFGKSLSSL